MQRPARGKFLLGSLLGTPLTRHPRLPSRCVARVAALPLPCHPSAARARPLPSTRAARASSPPHTAPAPPRPCQRRSCRSPLPRAAALCLLPAPVTWPRRFPRATAARRARMLRPCSQSARLALDSFRQAVPWQPPVIPALARVRVHASPTHLDPSLPRPIDVRSGVGGIKKNIRWVPVGRDVRQGCWDERRAISDLN